MHIVIIAWLFVTFTMALTMRSALAGVALFLTLGLAPVLIVMAIAMRRLRARRERDFVAEASMRERDVNGGDDRDAGGDH